MFTRGFGRVPIRSSFALRSSARYIKWSPELNTVDPSKTIEALKSKTEPRRETNAESDLFAIPAIEKAVAERLEYETERRKMKPQTFNEYGSFEEAKNALDDMISNEQSLTAKNFNEVLQTIVNEKLGLEHLDALKRMMRRLLVHPDYNTLILFAQGYHDASYIKGIEEILARCTPSTPSSIRDEIDNYYTSLRKKLLL